MKKLSVLVIAMFLSFAAIAQTETQSPAALAKDTITNSKELSQGQKDKLLALQEATMTKVKALREEIETSKLALVQIALEPKMSRKEYNALKKKITKLEKERMETGFKAIEQARDIIDPAVSNQGKAFSKAFINTHLIEF